MLKLVAIFLVVLIAVVNCESFDLNVLMPHVSPKIKDTYLCTKVKLDENKPIYITEFQPHSTQEIAHHMLLFGCEVPFEEETWDCGEMSNNKQSRYKRAPVCLGKQSIIYAWALDAPNLKLPNDVAFKIGGNTDAKYLVLQVHYANVEPFLNGGSDNSGLVLKAQTESVGKRAGVYILETAGTIRSHTRDYFEAACELREDVVMYPFAFRTHTHKLGLVNSGYLVKPASIYGNQEWSEIGIRSPQLPQMFFPVSKRAPFRKGSILAARCTMENYRDVDVSVGPTGNDEMCNFYIMYYVKGDKLPTQDVCYTQGPPDWYFRDFVSSKGETLDHSLIPEEASQIPIKQQLELAKNGGGHQHHKSPSHNMVESMEMPSFHQEDSYEQDELENSLRSLEEDQEFKRLAEYLNRKNHE